MSTHNIFRSLIDLKGNAHGCVYTEPLWGIPYFLIAPYVSVYMLAFGLKDSQIGLIVSIGLVFQILAAVFSGAITDKWGRRRTTFIFDFLSWSIPMLIWAAAQNFTYFVIAAVVNALWRVTYNSWTCLLVEDTDPKQLVDIYTWIYMAGLLAPFFSPLTGLLIERFSLVPTMRGLYIFAFVMMTIKFLATNAMVTETQQGLVRMQETKHQSWSVMMVEYRDVIRNLFRTPQTLYTIGIMLVMSICAITNNTFWAIIVTKKINIPAEHIAYFPFARSIVLLFFYFLLTPRIRSINFRNPMLVGLAGFIISQLILILVPERNYVLLLISVLIDACSFAAVGIQVDRMLVVTVEPKERSRIMAIINVVVISFATPFGWIAGNLSQLNRILPFVMNMAFYALGGVLVFLAARWAARQEEAEEAAETLPT